MSKNKDILQKFTQPLAKFRWSHKFSETPQCLKHGSVNDPLQEGLLTDWGRGLGLKILLEIFKLALKTYDEKGTLRI